MRPIARVFRRRPRDVSAGPMWALAAGVLLTLMCLAGPVARADDGGLPLEGSTETLEFPTDEGTWISVTLSVGGDIVYFDLLGDIYRVPIRGGEATPIRTGLAFDSQPDFSPDGEWLAFISDEDGADNVHVMNLRSGETRQLSSERHARLMSPTWTPDGQYVVVTMRTAETAFRMYHIDGGDGVTLANDADSGRETNIAGPGAAISPDGRHLYFAQSTEPGANQMPTAQIARLDLQTGHIDPVTQGVGGGVRPVLSNDGRWLAYATRHETQAGLRLRDLETGADRWLAWPVGRDAQEGGPAPSRDFLPNYEFTPDNDAVVISYGGMIRRIDIATGEIGDIPFVADVSLDIGPDLTAPYRVDDGPVRARLVQSPAFSPDGRRVAASMLTKIYTFRSNRTPAPRRLTDVDAWEFQPVWSPNARWIAYVSWSMEDGGHIWRMRADGSGQPQRLTRDAAFYTDIAFTPDGERIVALRGSAFQRHQLYTEFFGQNYPLDIVWLPANGGEATLVAPARGARSPHFTADASRIYLSAEDALISLQFDGSDERRHLRVEGPMGNRFAEEPPTAARILARPDGRWALALVNGQLWAIATPPAGGETPTVSVRSPALPAARLTDIGADQFGWADEGRTVMWSIGSTLYRRPFDSIEFYVDEDAEEDETADGEEVDAADDGEDAPGPLREEHEAVERLDVALTAPRAMPSGAVVLRGADVIAMTGDTTADMERVVPSADVLVVNNRIAAIGPVGGVDLPNGAEIIDVSGQWITPGFIDTHAHWELRVGDVLEPHSWSLAANLAYGVTSGLDVQTSHDDYFAYRDLVDTGQTIGQRAFMTGPGIFGDNDFESYEATRAYLQRYADHYRTNNIKSYLVGNRRQRQWVVRAAQELGLMPTTEGGGDLKLDLTHAIDGMHGNEHNLPEAPVFNDVIQLYAATQTAYTPTLLVHYNGAEAVEYFFTREEAHDDAKLARFTPHNRLDELTRRRSSWMREDEFNFDEAAADVAKLQRAGGLVGVGGHGELQGLGYHWEMWSYALGGMQPVEILRAATIDGARILGVSEDLGSVEVGKLADLVVLDANPLEDIRNTTAITYVMKNGELFDGDTLDQIWPEQRAFPPFWWWDEAANPQP